MPRNNQTIRNYIVKSEVDRPHDIARIPQAVKVLLQNILNDVQLNLLIENGTIELTVPEFKAQRLESALKPLTVRMLLRQFGIRITINPVEVDKPEGEDPDVQESAQFKVSGLAVMEDGRPVSGIMIRAVDRNLRSEDFLGETVTNTAGRYEIPYTFEQFERAEKGTADLIIRALNEVGTLLAESDIHFNAPHEAVINLTISKTAPIVPSEYELLNAMLTPLLNGVTLSELTEKDIWFLINKTDIEEISQMFPAGRRSIELLAKSAVLFIETNLYAEVFYGLTRVYFPHDGAETPDLKDLIAEEPEWWQEGLSKACAANIIPAWVCERLDEVLRNVDRLRRGQELNDQEQWIRQEVVVRLVNKKTEAPVPGFMVRAYDVDPGEKPEEIRYSISGGLGKLTLFYAVPPDGETSSSRNLHLVASRPGGEEISSHSELWRPGMTLQLEVDVPETPEVGATPISEVITSMEVEEGELRELLAHLETKGISTLADIRRIRGLDGVEGLPLAPDNKAVRTLEAHARLAILPTEVTDNQNLINAGYSSAIQIADTSPEVFARRVSDEFDNIEAARIHAESAAITSVLESWLRCSDRLAAEIRWKAFMVMPPV